LNQETQSTQASITIIGSGLAGYTVIREIRKLDKNVPITLITKEPGYFYSKPMLSTALANKKDAKQLISTPSAEMASQLSITILGQTEVSAINLKQQEIKTQQ
jgi:rubredoxin-NAD+ reductase